MKATLNKAVVRWFGGRWETAIVVIGLTAAMGAIACGGYITVFQDDFQAQTVGANPGLPQVGEPWRISEVTADGIKVMADRADATNNVLFFGPYRNTALAPFSPQARQLIALARNAQISFDYYGFTGALYSQYFDIGAYDPVGGDPAFFLRIMPETNAGAGKLHNVRYLDPVRGLVDTGLDIAADKKQAISIVADFAAQTWQLDVAGSSATLPLFTCPNEIVGVQFANYGVAVGSGTIDNLAVTVAEPGGDGKDGPTVPELATCSLLVIGALTLAYVRLMRRRTR